MSNLISKEEAIKAIISESLKDGSYGYMDTKSIVDLLNDLPSAQPEQYTKEELKTFLHGLSLSLLSLRSAQQWVYDDKTAEECKFLSHLYKKVEADMKGKA